ncbi:hypothetical protein [Streptococcus sanguinis]|uniref:hypothetical protein n=1 Tax=Streptococcus sanguinis TaxID=1305 RepID=UPI001CBDF91F|nr:hypothetical protein [Streptococcus sanguinis]MBZ2021407.1 hypothetical protein [Streptococcus sanguinis]MBZ2073748.1 hypothetical protein [Streptococcus sanguinis]MBZ2081671.1 hypothetical protein [Streptococcus sanguinis]MCC3165749.1 hypothetical protein [Streptococcus sanguinis]
MINFNPVLKEQLQEKEDLTIVIKNLVHLIPDRCFYSPEVEENQTYRDYQLDIQELVQEVRKFKRPADREMLSSLIKQYLGELKALADGKRRRLEEKMLELERSQQVLWLLFLAAKYHKEKFLLESKTRR